MPKLKALGIDTFRETVVYLHENSPICRSAGFEPYTRVRVSLGDKSILATLNMICSHLLGTEEASLSCYAWHLLGAKEGDEIAVSHPRPVHSLSSIRKKIYGNVLEHQEIQEIVEDVAQGRLSNIHIAAFLSACAGGGLNTKEVIRLTNSMVSVGSTMAWGKDMIVDKHCLGGLPGNRTTMILVPIVAAFGLTIPKTSSRAITSPAGTADTMEVFAPVDLDLKQMKSVVEKENGCIVWGGGVTLSPADDFLIQVESALELDSEGQLVASVLSKKIAAGSTHIVIDCPVGPTAKIRSHRMEHKIKRLFDKVSKHFGLEIKIIVTDGHEPVGRGIGPALEARDVKQVLMCQKEANLVLRDRALVLAGAVLEFSDKVRYGQGIKTAEHLLDSGKAWEKFQAICQAQGGMREIPVSQHIYAIESLVTGRVNAIDNRKLSRLARLAGAPRSKEAGVDMHIALGEKILKGQPLMTLHAGSRRELEYALKLYRQGHDVVQISM